MNDAPPAQTPPGSGADARLRFGTSSFSCEDWVGPFYPQGTKPADFLRIYATRYDTVEVDATYYAIPSPRTVDGWNGKTPDDFLLAAKFPRSIVHAGKAAQPDVTRLLLPDATYRERDRFLAVMQRLGPKLGPLVLQFPYFNKKTFPSPEPFFERLDAFLADLPEGPIYCVEVRNRGWFSRELADLCRRHGACLVLMDQAWMPHGDEVERRFDVATGPLVYVRLLGDRKEIEALTTRWDREVLDRGDRLARWAALLTRLVGRGVSAVTYVNNHYAGHAPATLERLKSMVEAAKEAREGEP